MHAYRKVTEEDLFGKSTKKVKIKSSKNLKIQKHQKDYGDKKYIKP